ncbi:MAG TPA: M48 family metallopeptidase [Gammaproteobacteria bacterium]
MNFFKRQHEARRLTSILVANLLAAVVLIVIAINAVVYAAVVMSGAHPADLKQWLQMPWWSLISLGTVLVIAIGSLVRYLRLRDGGQAVAELMGARKLNMSSNDANERRFINVVEEMSIASGTPVPDLYIMDAEAGINAFVAGYQPDQAVMVVTRGALEHLNRDELQGVVGHEFSHVLNGDMRLNVRLMAILAGILTIGVAGRLMMRALRGGRISGSGGSRSGQGQAAVFSIGLALFLIGYIGLFFGRLIKAAVSRQREFLADASSVQFTRNPDGIAGALWKIQQHTGGSLLVNDNAEETSHMCFGQSMQFSLSGLLATHPPLEVRIERVDRHFRAKRAAEGFRQKVTEQATSVAPDGAALGFAAGGAVSVTEPASVVQSVGNLRPEHVAYAKILHESIPESVLEAVHDPGTAPWIVYAILLGDVAQERVNVARALIRHEMKSNDDYRLMEYCDKLRGLDVRFRLPLIDLATPALRRQSADDRDRMVTICDKVSRIDREVTLFEVVLLTLLKKHLVPFDRKTVSMTYRSFDPVIPEIRVLLTLIARAGSENVEEIEKNFVRGMQTFTKVTMSPAAEEYCGFDSLEPVLRKLSGLSPLLKESLLTACADCIIHDGEVTLREAEILRAISESLDCPMPPLQAGGSLLRAA